VNLLSQKIEEKQEYLIFVTLQIYLSHTEIGFLQHIRSPAYSVPKFPPRNKGDRGSAVERSLRPLGLGVDLRHSNSLPSTNATAYLLLMHLESCHGWSVLYVIHMLWAVIATARPMEKCCRVPSQRWFTLW